MGLKLHCGYVICYCYLVGNIIVHTQPSSLSSSLHILLYHFYRALGMSLPTINCILESIDRYMVCFLAGSWPDNKEWMSETRGDAKVIPTRTNKLSWEIEKVEESWGVNEVGAREHVCSLFFRDGDWSVRTSMGVQKTYSPDGVRKTVKSGRIFQRGNPWLMHYSHQQAPRSWKSGRAAVDSVACPSTFKVKGAET